MNDLPDDPIVGFKEAALGQHELFLSWVAAGFSEPQAMQLLCAAITALIVKGSGEVSS